MKTYYKAKKIFLEKEILKDYFMAVENGKIEGFYQEISDEYIDYSDLYIAPGLVDTHIHGFKNADIMDAKEGNLNIISKGILEMGVTSFLPTTLTASAEQLNNACEIVGKEYKTVEGAKVRGIFLEGPFFTEKYKGAQNPNYMGDPDIQKLKKWKDLSDGLVNKIAIAPERENVEEFIRLAKEIGVYVALGHSDATYEEAVKAVNAGANIFIHTYNGMRGLHHREPGMVGAALNTDTISELICDGFHVHPISAKIVMDHKSRDHVALVTDCMRAGGMPDGNYFLGEFPVKVEKGTARLEDGSLAGSLLKLSQAVKNVLDWNIATAKEAIDMATIIPAKSVGIDDVCGILKEGREADFIVLDEKLNLKKTYLDGNLVFEA
ncbi:MAG: N-acetylglucosamine-6-phosphate deacetylase [Tissierellia bacterium]|nr:N-acetylglucosamine-6-phosphate deacetylase [Tissierellia bacterium]